MIMKVTKNDSTIFQDARSINGDGLWNISLPSSTLTINSKHTKNDPSTRSPSMKVIILKVTVDKDSALYLHAAYFSPSKDTLTKQAI